MTTAFWGKVERTVAPDGQALSAARVVRKDIVIESLSASQWRVCDSEWCGYDEHRPVGFIEKKEDGLFEVMQLEDGFEWYTFSSLAEAEAHFTTAQPRATSSDENMLSRLRAHADRATPAQSEDSMQSG